MDPYEQEPVLVAEEPVLMPARIAATAATALPAVGLGLLCLSQGISEVGGAPRVDCVFHTALGVTMLLLFADVALVIGRSKTLVGILFAGVLGFVAAFAAAVLAEVGGPPALALVAAAIAIWGVLLLSRRIRHR